MVGVIQSVHPVVADEMSERVVAWWIQSHHCCCWWCYCCRRFFALPLDVKKGARRTQDNSMGYFNDEYTKQKMDLKEGFDFRHVQVRIQPMRLL